MKRYIWFLLLVCLGCTRSRQETAVHVSMINSNHSVKFTGLEYAIISDINRDSVQGIWQGLIPVYRMPADTELKDYQPVQPGRYQLKDSSVVFTPDTPFVKGQIYYMRYFKFGEGQTIWDFIKSKKRLGSTQHIDLIFGDKST